MYVAKREDLKYLDAFHPPTIFDDSIDLYKEWHHFVLYDDRNQLFGIMNFSITGNPYSFDKGFVTAIVVFVDDSLEWKGNIESYSIDAFRFSTLHPHILVGEVSITYNDDTYHLFGRLRSQHTYLDLHFKIDSSPITIEMMPPGEYVPIWNSWIGVSRLSVSGKILIDGKKYTFSNALGYHDHNRGRFKWGDPVAWESGFMLDDIHGRESAPFIVGFGIDRSPVDENEHLSVAFLLGREGPLKTFAFEQVQVRKSGTFNGPYFGLPGAAQILYPSQPRDVPSAIEVSSHFGSDWMRFEFKPRSVCQIAASNHLGEGLTLWREIFGTVDVEGFIDEVRFRKTSSAYLESVRPSQ